MRRIFPKTVWIQDLRFVSSHPLSQSTEPRVLLSYLLFILFLYRAYSRNFGSETFFDPDCQILLTRSAHKDQRLLQPQQRAPQAGSRERTCNDLARAIALVGSFKERGKLGAPSNSWIVFRYQTKLLRGGGGKREIESKRRRGRREKERKELLSLLNMKMFSYLITIYVCSIDGQYCRDRCDVPLCKCYITYSSRAGIDVCIDFENVWSTY